MVRERRRWGKEVGGGGDEQRRGGGWGVGGELSLTTGVSAAGHSLHDLLTRAARSSIKPLAPT